MNAFAFTRWQHGTQHYVHDIHARFCNWAEQFWPQSESHTKNISARLYDTHSRNWQQFPGTRLWYQILNHVSWALAQILECRDAAACHHKTPRYQILNHVSWTLTQILECRAAFPLSGVTAYLTHKFWSKRTKKKDSASSDAKDFPVDAQFHMAVRQVDAVIAYSRRRWKNGYNRVPDKILDSFLYLGSENINSHSPMRAVGCSTR